MKKKQVSESDFDFFNISSELSNAKTSKQTEKKSEVDNKSVESTTKAKVGKKSPSTKSSPKKRRVQKVDELFIVEEEERDPFKTVQIRTSLWRQAESISKKIEEKSGRRYSATKVLNRILEDYFDK